MTNPSVRQSRKPKFIGPIYLAMFQGLKGFFVAYIHPHMLINISRALHVPP